MGGGCHRRRACLGVHTGAGARRDACTPRQCPQQRDQPQQGEAGGQPRPHAGGDAPFAFQQDVVIGSRGQRGGTTRCARDGHGRRRSGSDDDRQGQVGQRRAPRGPGAHVPPRHCRTGDHQPARLRWHHRIAARQRHLRRATHEALVELRRFGEDLRTGNRWHRQFRQLRLRRADDRGLDGERTRFAGTQLLRHGGVAHPQVAHRQPRLRCTCRLRTHLQRARRTGDIDLATVAAQQVVHPATGAPPFEACTRHDQCTAALGHQQEATLGRAVAPSVDLAAGLHDLAHALQQRAVGRIQIELPRYQRRRVVQAYGDADRLLYIRVRIVHLGFDEHQAVGCRARGRRGTHLQGQRRGALVAHLQRGDGQRARAPRTQGQRERGAGAHASVHHPHAAAVGLAFHVEVAHQWREVRRGGHRIGFHVERDRLAERDLRLL